MSTRTQQCMMVEFTGSNNASDVSGGKNDIDRDDCIAELERTANAIDGKIGDTGPLQPVNRRVASVVTALEKQNADIAGQLQKALLTLEAIGQAESA